MENRVVGKDINPGSATGCPNLFPLGHVTVLLTTCTKERRIGYASRRV